MSVTSTDGGLANPAVTLPSKISVDIAPVINQRKLSVTSTDGGLANPGVTLPSIVRRNDGSLACPYLIFPSKISVENCPSIKLTEVYYPSVNDGIIASPDLRIPSIDGKIASPDLRIPSIDGKLANPQLSLPVTED